jgi:hypothetical protein
MAFPQSDPSDLATKLRAEVYYDALIDCTIEELEHAAGRAIKERGRVFMPSAGELLQHVDAIRYERRMNEQATTERQRVLTAAPPTAHEEAEVRKLLDELNDRLKWR